MKKKTLFSGLALITIMIGLSTSQSNETKAAAPDKTATVNYVKGYGIATWRNIQSASSVTGHYLPTGSKWLVNTTVTGTDGQPWYLVGNNEWASSKYYDLGNENSVQDLNAVIKINYKSGHTVNTWETPRSTVNSKVTGKVANGDEFKTTRRAVIKGVSWYEIGSEQWVADSYAVIKNETSRDEKVFSYHLFLK